MIKFFSFHICVCMCIYIYTHTYTDLIVWISVAILILLFLIQRFGTDKVGYTFSPILCFWFVLIFGIGIYNILKFDPSVVKAVNPMYIIEYFRRNKKEAWMSLGGVVLCTTGCNFFHIYIRYEYPFILLFWITWKLSMFMKFITCKICRL